MMLPEDFLERTQKCNASIFLGGGKHHGRKQAAKTDEKN
ncbi:hypothetical protein I656_01453 [Geobacillus sp. WSUCF1]|nr:hypothetical protein I656_01453 [Geobacillus sp. WSUCF1]